MLFKLYCREGCVSTMSQGLFCRSVAHLPFPPPLWQGMHVAPQCDRHESLPKVWREMIVSQLCVNGLSVAVHQQLQYLVKCRCVHQAFSPWQALFACCTQSAHPADECLCLPHELCRLVFYQSRLSCKRMMFRILPEAWTMYSRCIR